MGELLGDLVAHPAVWIVIAVVGFVVVVVVVAKSERRD